MSDLTTAKVSGLTSCPEVDVGLRVHGCSEEGAVLSDAGRDVVLGDGQHSARPAARVADRQHRAPLAHPHLVAGQQEVHHQVDDIAGREVLARVLVQRFVELPDQLLEDRPHRGVVDLVGVQVHVLEAFENLEDDMSIDEVVEQFPVTRQQIKAVLAFAGRSLVMTEPA